MAEPNRSPGHGKGRRSVASSMRWNTLAIVAFWLVVMAGLYLVMDRVRQPRAAVQAADGTLVIPRGSDGHFHVAGSVNGQPVRFLVDTGASLVVVTDALAQRAGLDGGQVAQFQTANGVRRGRVVKAQAVAVQSFAVTGLTVGVGYSGSNTEDALLGQNFLQHFEVQLLRDRMVLKPHR